MTYDEDKARDAAADDADQRPVVCPACHAGDHDECDGDCDCDCRILPPSGDIYGGDDEHD